MATIKRVGVCGAGAMGGGIAQVAATAGHEVVVFDMAASAIETGRGRLVQGLAGLAKRGKLSAEDGERIAGAVRWTTAVEDLAACDLIVEAVIEDLNIKRALLARLEAIATPGTILASNTSSLPIARLARGLERPHRFLGMHFFNPPTAMKLVEVVRGPATHADVERSIVDLALAWGKVPVEVADVPGFIVNRVARPFYAEAFRALQERAAPAGVIDHLLCSAAGFRMGPLELTDLIGQDVNFTVARSVYDAYFGATRFTPQLAQGALVDAGWLGRKTGRGVYDYSDGAPSAWMPEPPMVSDGRDRAALPDAPDSEPIELDGVTIRQTRGRTARDEARLAGGPVALLDWFDPTGSSVGFAVSDERAGAVVSERIGASGRSAVRIADRPGLVVIRILAQIANAAGDAVLEHVSDEAGIDKALMFGANYPFGPCAWARRIGVGALCRTLTGIAEATGQGMYQPSQYWREQCR